jgi:hypothetical protein
VKTALVALKRWLLWLGGFAYFLLPSDESKEDNSDCFLTPLNGGYVAFRCDGSAPHSVAAYQRQGLQLMDDVSEILSLLSEVSDGADLAESLIDALQKRLDHFQTSACCHVTRTLFGLHATAAPSAPLASDCFASFSALADVDFATLLTQLNATMLTFVTPHELLAAACNPNHPAPAKSIFFPNIVALNNARECVCGFIATSMTAAAVTSSSSAAACFSRFIAICNRLRFEGNFEGLVAVLAGLEKSISSHSFEGISQTDQDCYNRLQRLIHHKNRYKASAGRVFIHQLLTMMF